MSLPRYPAYKDSGVAWLGEVPGHWWVKPVKAVASCNDEVLDESTPADYEIEYVEISGVDAGRGITSTDVIPFGGAPSRARRRVQDGDVLVSTVRTYLRSIAPINNPPDNMIASTGFAVVRPRMIKPHFLGYLFQAEFLISEVIARSVGVSYPAINASDLMRLKVPIPFADEQSAIAAFLDRETGKIDTLVAEQEKLIQLLREKRQAVISRAVTKGINPAAPMKDSGIEWLGEVPEHWKVARLKYKLRLLTEKTERREHPIALENIESGTGHFIETETEFEGEGIAFEQGDILFGKLRPYLAKVYLVEIAGEAVGDFHVLRPVGDVVGRFAQYQIISGNFIAIVDSSTFGAKMPRVAWEFMGNMPFVTPPLEEQKAIATFLDRETAKLDALTAVAQRGIELLKERRSALISAAVTGKIDVRTFSPVLEAA